MEIRDRYPLRLCRLVYHLLNFSDDTLKTLECDVLYIASIPNSVDNNNNHSFDIVYEDNENKYNDANDVCDINDSKDIYDDNDITEIPKRYDIIEMERLHDITLHFYPSLMQQSLYDSMIKTPQSENIIFILHYPFNRDLNEDHDEFHYPIFESILRTLYCLTSPVSTNTIDFEFKYEKEAFLFMDPLTREVCFTC